MLAALNKEMKADLEVMKINLHNALAEKEEIIISQRKTIEEYDEKLRSIAGKDELIAPQSKTISEYDEKLCVLTTNDDISGIKCNQIRKYNVDAIFRTKPKRKGAKTSR